MTEGPVGAVVDAWTLRDLHSCLSLDVLMIAEML